MADDREALGRIVRETWVAWALEQPDVADHPSWTVDWDGLPDRDREVDMRIGFAVAAAERERAERAEAALAAIRKRLRVEQGSWIRIKAIRDIAGEVEGEVR